MSEQNQTECILQAIHLTQKLRSSVAKVFQNMADGCSVEKGNEKQILNKFHESLLAVNNDISDLEKTGNMLVSPSPVTANSMYLSNDPAIDKTPVYQQILQAYKWSNKISDLSGLAANVLEAQNKLKRSQPITIMQAKRPKRLPPTGHAFPQNVVEQTLNRLRKLPEISDIKTTHPLGSHAVLQITLGSVLKAQVALRGLMIEWVNVRGYTEENPDDSKLELWAKSRYEVFQKVTESCTAASLYFYTPHNAEFAINLFMKWFTQYRTLFSARCSKCCNHYLNGLPPTWRDLATYEPYHDACRQ